MGEDKIRMLAIGDGVSPTGFSRVMHSILGRLDKSKYDIHQIAVNYYGDPHDQDYKIYPAVSKGDIYGVNRISEFADKKIDIIFLLNDLWIIDLYLNAIKSSFKSVPKIVTYSPVDGYDLDKDWFRNFSIVTQPVFYTEFGYNEAIKADEDVTPIVIPHGIDRDLFHTFEMSKVEIKKLLYPDKPDFYEDSFIVLNANRNQPRKRIDIAIEGFALFAKDKPLNVKYYHHAGITDMGWDVIKLTKKLKIDDRLILTNFENSIQRVSDEKLNIIYNATDVGINTSLGEGWGLPNMEHASVGAPQIVPNNSASAELFNDCGLLIPISQPLLMEKTSIVGGLVKAEDVATKLEELYVNKDLYNDLSKKSLDKFSQDYYSWDNIASMWDKLFKRVLND